MAFHTILRMKVPTSRLPGDRLPGGRLSGGGLSGGRLSGGRLSGGRLPVGRLPGGRLPSGRLPVGRLLGRLLVRLPGRHRGRLKTLVHANISIGDPEGGVNVGPQIGMNPIPLWGLPDLEY